MTSDSSPSMPVPPALTVVGADRTPVPQEFWAHWGKKDHVGWSSGQVSVKAETEDQAHTS